MVDEMEAKVIRSLYAVACCVYRGDFGCGCSMDVDGVQEAVNDSLLEVKEAIQVSEEC